jgi:hypothetical protein
MSLNRLAASLGTVVFLAAFSVAGQPPAINVETWPDDVPCDVLKKICAGISSSVKIATERFHQPN